MAVKTNKKILDPDLLLTLLDNLGEGVSIQDSMGHVLYANSTTLKTFGYTYDEIIGITSKQLAQLGSIDYSYSDWVLEHKKSISGWQTFVNTGGLKRAILSHVTPLFNDNGEIAYIIAINRDMGELCPNFADNCKNARQLRTGHTITKKTPIFTPSSVICESKAMKDIVRQVGDVADTDASILLKGETGSGKDVIANLIHSSSSRKKKNLIRINSAAVPESLMESEFFGYEKNSFTGALSNKKGLLEEANQSTFFLDEVNSLPLSMQGKLLSALETKTVRRIGSSQQISTDFRLISATNQNLKQLVAENKFRMDLYYRLNVISITVPPLRDRKEDIIPLVKYYLKYYSDRYKREKSFSNDVLDDFLNYNWPGNVRELKNVVERLVLASEDSITLKRLPDNVFSSSTHFDFPKTSPVEEYSRSLEWIYDRDMSLEENLEQYEKKILKCTIDKHKTMTSAAIALGISQPTISRKVAKYELNKKD